MKSKKNPIKITTMNESLIAIYKNENGFLLEDLITKSNINISTCCGYFLGEGEGLFFVDINCSYQIIYDRKEFSLHPKKLPFINENERYFLNIPESKKLASNYYFKAKPNWYSVNNNYIFWNNDNWIWILDNSIVTGKVEGTILTATFNKDVVFLCYRRGDKTYYSCSTPSTTNSHENLLTKEIAKGCTFIEDKVVVSISSWPSDKLLIINFDSRTNTKFITPHSYIHGITSFNNKIYALMSSFKRRPTIEPLHLEKIYFSDYELLNLNNNQSFYFPEHNDNLIVFLHGGPIGSWVNIYNPIVEALSDLNQSILLLNNSGSVTYSNKPSYRAIDYGRKDLKELTKTINQFKTKYKKIHLIGESYGGYLAWLYATNSCLIETVTILNGFVDPRDLISDNPAIKVLKKTLPIPSTQYIQHPCKKALYIGANEDKLISVERTVERCKELNIIPCIINSPHNVEKQSEINKIIYTLKSFIEVNCYEKI